MVDAADPCDVEPQGRAPAGEAPPDAGRGQNGCTGSPEAASDDAGRGRGEVRSACRARSDGDCYRPIADGVDGAPNGIKRAKMVVV